MQNLKRLVCECLCVICLRVEERAMRSIDMRIYEPFHYRLRKLAITQRRAGLWCLMSITSLGRFFFSLSAHDNNAQHQFRIAQSHDTHARELCTMHAICKCKHGGIMHVTRPLALINTVATFILIDKFHLVNFS